MSEVQNQSAPARAASPPGAVALRMRRLPALWAASPFALMRQFSMDVDRLFGEALTDGPPTPQIEVFERDGKFVVRADLPGFSKNDVAVDLADDVLTISGERHDEHEQTRQGVRVSERHYGRFSRRVPLPEGAEAEKAQATFHNGVLEVAIPAPAVRQSSRRIEIQDGTGAGTPNPGEQTQTTS